ncbi:hypothetical protein Sjap_026426 [Stephania japonica]|uniref:RING-type domain-containing protein n=1 Tax=Stephania japonica TaxID=461633 RepID=A0AAP0E644_9MAGN
MGNKLGRRRHAVEEKYTRPQGLYQHSDVDHKKLRKLILDSKLAPCYPGDDECACDLEECPICFLYYPSLNRSTCCTKGICTECFLQMKPPHSTRPTQCPFCKTSNYQVEYRGVRSKEEKGMEQVEEQKVIEAKIRMQQQELLDEEERLQRKQNITSTSRVAAMEKGGYRGASSSSLAVPSVESLAIADDAITSQGSRVAPSVQRQLRFRQNGEEQFDVDLEDIMMMEAIWLSIQDNGMQRSLACGNVVPSEPYTTECRYISPTIASYAETSSPSGGLACAIAALAERQHTDGDSANDSGRASACDTTDNWTQDFPVRGAGSGEGGDWVTDNGSEVAEAGTSYGGSDTQTNAGESMTSLHDSGGDQFRSNVAGPIVPESFEEQMMLAMAMSIAEARGRTNSQGVTWL